MGEDTKAGDGEVMPKQGVGKRLKSAREGKGLSLEDVGEVTRIPMRHLQVIESGDWSALPSRTYAVGFSKSYAKAVDLDPNEIAEEVRHEMGIEAQAEVPRPASTFEPGDPARVSSKKLAWFSAFAAILLAIGAFAYFSDYFIPGSGPPSLSANDTEEEGNVEMADGSAQDADAAVQPAGGPVVFTALEDQIWVRFYEADGERLLEKTLAKGERYTVPADAKDPQLNTGRPDALAISIGGKNVPKLADEPQTMGEAKVSAEALLARGSTSGDDGAETSTTEEAN